jgi:hypothetical protein
MTNETQEFEAQKPITETSMGLSKDKKFFIHRTTITDIKPVKYVEKVMSTQEGA